MKKFIIIGISISIILIGIIVIVITNNKMQRKTEKKEENKLKVEKRKNQQESMKSCISITGGNYDIIFNTDSDQKLENMSICIACAPDTYKDLPIPEKEGYEFEGWYLDKELIRQV